MRPEIMVGAFGSRHLRKLADCTDTTPIALFTVTGDVMVHIFGICKASLTGSSITVEVGVSGDTAVLLPQIVDATDLLINEIYVDATPTATIEDISSEECFCISNGQDIILTTTGTISTGQIEFHCFWCPLSDGASVRPAP